MSTRRYRSKKSITIPYRTRRAPVRRRRAVNKKESGLTKREMELILATRQPPVGSSFQGVAPISSSSESNDLLGDIAGLAGRAAAKIIPQLMGGGSSLGSMISGVGKVFGFGDYKISKNIFMQGRLPEMFNIPKGGGTIIRYQEYIGDIVTSSVAGSFNLQAFPINAAQSGTFPFLSQIAQEYEEYSFEGLLFEFRSTSADALNSTNTALGSVMMATNYDASDPNFLTKAEMLNYEYSTCVKPSDSAMHMIECDPKQTVLSKLYSRPGDLPAGDDIRMYDLGNFQIATTGFQGTSVNIGQLHCTYQVRLLKPKLFSTLGSGINFLSANNAVGVAAATPLGTVANWVVSSQTTLTSVIFTSSTVLTFPLSNVVEYYHIYYRVVGTVAGAVVAPVITYTNCTATFISFMVPPSGTASLSFQQTIGIQTHGGSTVPSLTFGVAGTFPTGTVTAAIIIYQIPPP